MKSFLAAVSLLVMAGSPMAQEVVFRDNMGGNAYAFWTSYRRMAENGTRLRIEGVCASACTLALAFDGLRVCAAKGAVLGFHKAFIDLTKHKVSQKAIDELNAAIYNSYPIAVRDFLTVNGWPDPMKGASRDELTFMLATEVLPQCKD